jgi:hypothetical protein
MQQNSPEYTVWLFPSFLLCIPSIVTLTYRHLPYCTYSRAFCKPLRLWQNAQLIVCLIQSEGIPSALLDLGVQLVAIISCISTLNASLHDKTHIITSSHPLDLLIEKPPWGQMGAFLCSFFLIVHKVIYGHIALATSCTLLLLCKAGKTSRNYLHNHPHSQ